MLLCISLRLVPSTRCAMSFDVLVFVFVLTDLCGSEDGSVRLWEFGRNRAISSHRNARSAPCVTKLHFTSHGNKVCLLWMPTKVEVLYERYVLVHISLLIEQLVVD